ncbi:MAG: hypothetical protein RIT43_222 [Bacteroidota bacterium]|jgi:hypothetical protein
MKKSFTNSRKKLLFTFGLLLSQVSWGQKTSVYFDKDSYELTQSTMHCLDSLIKTIQDPMEELMLVGHTDSDADQAYNEALSENRSRAVMDYLAANKVTNRIYMDFEGESKPLNSNKNEAQKTLNRRVEIVRNFHPDHPTFESSKKTPQVFYISQNTDTVLMGKEGTELWLKAGSFKTTDANGTVRLELTEFYDTKDFIIHGLSTSTLEGDILISGGMIHVEAFNSGDKVELKDGSEIQIKFRDKKEDDGMQTFYGAQGGSEVKWSENPELLPNTPVTLFHDKMFKIRNAADTMQIVTTKREIFQGSERQIVIREKRGDPKYPFHVTSDTVFVPEKDVVGSLFLSSSKMGFINCDKFDKTRGPRQDMIVSVDSKLKPQVYLVFKGMNSIMSYSSMEKNKCIFQKIPVKHVFDVVAIAIDSKAQVYAQILTNQSSLNGTLQIQLSPMDQSELFAKLEKLGVN